MRANKYAQQCADCGGRVPKGAGTLTKEDGRWLVRHASCAGVDPEGLEIQSKRSRREREQRFDTDGAPLAYVSLGYGRKGWRRGYEHTGYRCEDAPCCGCCS